MSSNRYQVVAIFDASQLVFQQAIFVKFQRVMRCYLQSFYLSLLETLESRMMQNEPGPAYTNFELRGICDLLQQLTPDDYRSPECFVKDGHIQPWAGLIDLAGFTYKVDVWEIENDPERVLPDDTKQRRLKKELVSFKRSVKRGFRNRRKFKIRYYRLSRDAKNLIAMAGWKSVPRKIHADLANDSAAEKTDLHLAKINGAIKINGRETGPKTDVPRRNLIAELASIYEEATGRTIGRGFNELDPSYRGPFERYLTLCLAPLMATPVSIDALRGEIRHLGDRRKRFAGLSVEPDPD